MFVINMGTVGYANSVSNAWMMVQTSDKANAKTFKTEKAAQKFIDKYADCGYGLVSTKATIEAI